MTLPVGVIDFVSSWRTFLPVKQRSPPGLTPFRGALCQLLAEERPGDAAATWLERRQPVITYSAARNAAGDHVTDRHSQEMEMRARTMIIHRRLSVLDTLPLRHTFMPSSANLCQPSFYGFILNSPMAIGLLRVLLFRRLLRLPCGTGAIDAGLVA